MAAAPHPGPTRRAIPFQSLVALHWLHWAAFFLLVVGVRLWLVANFGSATPILDQWDDEGARVFKPYVEGTLGIGQLVEPHNEHRPVLARLLALALLMGNGQWDARVQMAVNAVIAACLALFVAHIGVHLLGAHRRALVLGAVACWSCLPYAWENTLWGFQSSFYLLVLLSLVAIYGLIRQRDLSVRRGWLAAGAAVLACFTLASGFLSAVAVLALLSLRWLQHRNTLRAYVPTALLLISVIAFGVAAREHVAGHDVFRATSLLQWLDVFSRALAWPFTKYAAACVFVYLPIGVLAGWYVWRGQTGSPAASNAKVEVVLATALWVALQAGAIAYSRAGALTDFISPRYMDILALGAVANFFALFLIASEIPMQRGARGAFQLLGPAWVAAMFLGALSLGYHGLEDIQGRPEYLRQASAHVRGYVVTGDATHLANEFVQGVYPWPDRLAQLLDDASLRSMLPAVIRPPLALEPDGTTGPFVAQAGPPGERIWDSGATGEVAVGLMRTAVIRPALPYLWFGLRGSLGHGTSLRLEDDESGSLSRITFGANREPWRNGYAAAPRRARVVARDENTDRSFAFTDPREVGRLSYFAEVLLRHSVKLVCAGLALVIGAIVFAEFQRKRLARRLQ